MTRKSIYYYYTGDENVTAGIELTDKNKFYWVKCGKHIAPQYDIFITLYTV